VEISGDGVLEVLQGRLRFPRLARGKLLPAADDIYVSPEMIRQHSLRTGGHDRRIDQRRPDEYRTGYFGADPKVTQDQL